MRFVIASFDWPTFYFRLIVAIDIANVHHGHWSSSHSSVACSVVCRIANLLLLATGSASLQVWAGLVSVRGWDSNENNIILLFKKCTNKTVKRFQMKSTGCRDGQHTGLQSTQTRRNYSSNNTHRRRKRGG